MKNLLIKSLLILLLPIILTLGLCKYVPVPVLEIQKANAAFSAYRVMMGAAGSAGGGGDGTSYAFDGTGDQLQVTSHGDWSIIASSSQDYNVACFLQFTDHVGTENIFDQIFNANNRWRIEHTHGSGFRFVATSGAADVVDTGSGGEITDTDWHHFLLAKVTSAGPTVEWGIYVDGSIVAYVSDASTDSFGSILYIGMEGTGSSNPFDGNIDEVIIDKGNIFGAAPDAGLTDTITVPTEQHSDGTFALTIHCGETIDTGTTGSGATFTESGLNSHTVTEIGNAIRDTVNFKF